MLRKVWLLFNTVKYLKPIQIFYQIFYRFKSSKNLTFYLDRVSQPIIINPLFFDGKILPKTHVTVAKEFDFLNLNKHFDTHINWDFQEFGKLWNYNLQYFNYLDENNLTDETKINWLIGIGSWLRNGKLKLEPYPVSLRIMNTIRFCSQKKINDQKVLSELRAQIYYLEQHIEYHLLGNHLLENGFSLIMGGCFFNNQNWVKKAKSILYKQLEEQTLNDGCHIELSPMYHQIILFRVLELIDWYDEIDDDPDFLAFLNGKALKMCSFLSEITFSNGDIPHFNDSTINIALKSEQLLSYANSLGLNDFPPVKLKESGYRSFNYGNYECVVDVGAIGPTYQPGHSHADALSFIVYHQHQPLLVEVGTSTYQIGERRDLERSTCSHNTVVIGNANQSQVWGGFRAGKRANVKIIEDGESILKAAHNGYLANFGVLHQRFFSFLDGGIEIIDEIGDIDGEANFHFHPACNVIGVDEKTILVDYNISIIFEGAGIAVVKDYEYSSGFNKYQKAKKVVVTFNKMLRSSIKF